MATDLGKVGIRMRGTWDSSTAYEVLDAVTYQGSLYIAKQAVPANTVPTNTTYWQLASDAAAFADGMTFSRLTNIPSNLQIKYMGSKTSFELSGITGSTGLILFYAGYPNASGTGVNRRGIYLVDFAGNILDLSNQGYTLPTVEVGTGKMTITLPYSYAYLFIVTDKALTFSIP